MKQKKKGFINLLESVLFICKGKLIPLIPTNFLFLLSHFFPLNAQQWRLTFDVIPPLFPTRPTPLALPASSYFQTTKATNGRLFATSTIYWKSVPHRQSPHRAIHYSGGRTMRGCEHKFQERMNFSPFF